MMCDKCGRNAPHLGDPTVEYATDWPFEWCPFCVEREMKNPFQAQAELRSGGVIWKDSVGTMREAKE